MSETVSQPVNRIALAIELYQSKLDKVSVEQKSKLEKSLDIETLEFAAYQSLQSRAFASGVISLAEAQTIYMSLNEWDSRPLETKIAVTRILAELAKRELA